MDFQDFMYSKYNYMYCGAIQLEYFIDLLYRKSFADSANQAVVKILINEMERLNSKIPLVQIRGKQQMVSIYTYSFLQLLIIFCVL